MAHYALLDENNIVINVITGRNENEVVEGISDWETYYGEFHGVICKRTSYNTVGNEHLQGGIPFRKNYAGIGFTYDKARDAFIAPQPYDSWVLNEETCLWEAPVPMPEETDGDGNPVLYLWNEETGDWVEVPGA